jgi:hypothetical protein
MSEFVIFLMKDASIPLLPNSAVSFAILPTSFARICFSSSRFTKASSRLYFELQSSMLPVLPGCNRILPENTESW